MRLAGTWTRYSSSAIPQETSAAIHHGLSLRCFRWAYHAKVMKTLAIASMRTVTATGCERMDTSGPSKKARIVPANRAERRQAASYMIATFKKCRGPYEESSARIPCPAVLARALLGAPAGARRLRRDRRAGRFQPDAKEHHHRVRRRRLPDAVGFRQVL